MSRRFRWRRPVGAGLLFCTAIAVWVSPAAIRGQEDGLPTETDDEVRGASAAFSAIDQERQRIWLPAGSPLFERPDAASDRLAQIDALCEIEILEQSDDWYRVHFDGRIGWVKPDLPLHERGLNTLPVLQTVAVVTPGFELSDTSRRLELALEALHLSSPNGRLGPWSLLTDVTNPRLVSYLDRIAAGLASSYRARYGLEPAAAEEQTVALFSTEEAYRPFESEASYLAGLGARGHTGGNLAALFIEDNRMEEAATLLIHELTHLMNRSALGPRPPSWVEEGLANDMAYSRIDKEGRLRLGSLSGERIVTGNRRTGTSIQYTGAVAALAQQLRTGSRRSQVPLEQLVSLDQMQFLDAENRLANYIVSAFFVRFLLEGDKHRYADGFRAYLAALRPDEKAAAAAPGPELLDFIDADWTRLERGLQAWLEQQSAQLVQ